MTTFRLQFWSGRNYWNSFDGECSVCAIPLPAGTPVVVETTLEKNVGLDERWDKDKILRRMCVSCGGDEAQKAGQKVMTREPPIARPLHVVAAHAAEIDAANAASKPTKKGRTGR